MSANIRRKMEQGLLNTGKVEEVKEEKAEAPKAKKKAKKKTESKTSD